MVSLAGCSAEPVAVVEAKVLVQGEPVSEAQVIIEPDPSGKGAVFGMTKPDGTCVFDWSGRKGLAPGKYKILITHFEGIDGKAIPGGEEGQVLRQTGKVSRKTCLFRRDLPAGKTSLTLSLESADEQVQDDAEKNASMPVSV